jgi:glycerol-3-phosphate cytidylyltransferase
MKIVFTVGVFDYLHIGHVNMLRRAKALGDYLVVAVQDSSVVNRYKPEAKLLYSTQERMFMVGALRCVDQVITYQAVDTIIPTVNFDVFAIGPDQNHEGFQKAVEWCRTKGKEVVVIPRTEGISSSQLRK